MVCKGSISILSHSSWSWNSHISRLLDSSGSIVLLVLSIVVVYWHYCFLSMVWWLQFSLQVIVNMSDPQCISYDSCVAHQAKLINIYSFLNIFIGIYQKHFCFLINSKLFFLSYIIFYICHISMIAAFLKKIANFPESFWVLLCILRYHNLLLMLIQFWTLFQGTSYHH